MNALDSGLVMSPQQMTTKPCESIFFVRKKGSVTQNTVLFAGPRIYLGKPLAEMELFLFIVSVLQRFDLHRPDDTPPPKQSGTLGIVHPWCAQNYVQLEKKKRSCGVNWCFFTDKIAANTT